jgi:transposase InsO family protein
MTSPAKRRQVAEQVQNVFPISERRACRVIGISRSSQRYQPQAVDGDAPLTKQIVYFATRYGRYGYRRITALLRHEGWWVNHKRVERIWRREGLKVPQKQPKRRRLWLNDGSCVRLRPEHARHVWSYDFVLACTHNGRPFRILNVIDEYTRECLATRVARQLKADDVQDCLTELFCRHGVPKYVRSDNGPEFTARQVRTWLNELGTGTLFIEPGSPWENGYIESFNGKMRDELLNGEIFDTLLEAQVLIERWRMEYNRIRPHSALGYRPPAPEAIKIPDLATPLLGYAMA